jgi:hypothetical protein
MWKGRAYEADAAMVSIEDLVARLAGVGDMLTFRALIFIKAARCSRCTQGTSAVDCSGNSKEMNR